MRLIKRLVFEALFENTIVLFLDINLIEHFLYTTSELNMKLGVFSEPDSEQ